MQLVYDCPISSFFGHILFWNTLNRSVLVYIHMSNVLELFSATSTPEFVVICIPDDGYTDWARENHKVFLSFLID